MSRLGPSHELRIDAGIPPPEPSNDSTPAAAELQERLATAEAEPAASAQLRESLAVAEAEAAQVRMRLEATTAEADSMAAQLRQDAARSEAAQSELAEQRAAATSTREVTPVSFLLQNSLAQDVLLDAGCLSIRTAPNLAHIQDNVRSQLNAVEGCSNRTLANDGGFAHCGLLAHPQGLTINVPATQALQAELEARSAALAAAQADALAAGEATAKAERLEAQLERLRAERDDVAAALESMQQVCV